MGETAQRNREALKRWVVANPPQPPWHGFGIDPAPEILAVIRDADRLAEAEALLNRIDQRGHVGDQDHEDIQRLLSGGG